MTKRRHGTGSVTKLAEDKLWVRGPRQADGTRPTIGYAKSQEEADALLALGRNALATRPREGCPTFLAYGEKVLDAREQRARIDGLTYDPSERSRFRKHLATASFAKKPLDQITTPDGAQWLRAMKDKVADDRRGKRRLSKRTVARALSLANVIFADAGPQGAQIIPRNPFAELEPDGRVDDERSKWTFLELHEQEAVRDHTPVPWAHPMTEAEKLAILFGAGSGIRQGEQFSLRLCDLHVEGEPRAVLHNTKNGTTHEVPLFGMALGAARRWLEIRAAFLGGAKSALVFPTPEGKQRAVGKPLGNGHYRPALASEATHVRGARGRFVRAPKGQGTHRYVDRFEEVLVQCGVTRNVRWHDMRHTCASSLISGAWGNPVPQKVVQSMLNHTTSAMTDRYAHLSETALKKAVRENVKMGAEWVDGGGPTPSSVAAITNDIDGSHLRGLNSRPTVYEGNAVTELLRALARENEPHNPTVTHLANALAGLVEKTGGAA